MRVDGWKLDIAALPERTKEYPALYSEVTAADFLETFSPALSEQNSVAIPAEHELTEFPDWAHFREGFRARHQHQCRVCSI
ncbi:hypothetical protein PC112_g12037 [Phytophthora cactorum]|nr:hypothetical protein PC112_g12037 [Phytophthora cactorum]